MSFPKIGHVGRRVLALLVDDGSDDRLLFRHALNKSGLSMDLFEATDGSAGINYLLGQERFEARAKFPFPDLVILDLKMPASRNHRSPYLALKFML